MLLLDHCCDVAVVPAIEDHEFEILIDGKFGRLTLGIGQPVDEVEQELGGLVVARPCDVLRSDDKVFSVTLFEFGALKDKQSASVAAVLHRNFLLT